MAGDSLIASTYVAVAVVVGGGDDVVVDVAVAAAGLSYTTARRVGIPRPSFQTSTVSSRWTNRREPDSVVERLHLRQCSQAVSVP